MYAFTGVIPSHPCHQTDDGVASNLCLIVQLIIKRERDTLRSRSYGFITYHDTEVAAKAIQTLHMSELEGRLLKVGWPVEGPIAPTQGMCIHLCEHLRSSSNDKLH